MCILSFFCLALPELPPPSVVTGKGESRALSRHYNEVTEARKSSIGVSLAAVVVVPEEGFAPQIHPLGTALALETIPGESPPYESP